MNETGPLAIPPVERTRSSRGRRREKEKPVPPPLCRIRAAFFRVSKIPCIESSTGRTKQAANCPDGLPAFMMAGELGRNLSEEIRSKKRSSQKEVFSP